MTKNEMRRNQIKLETRVSMLTDDVRTLKSSMDTILKCLFPPPPCINTADYTADVLETLESNRLCNP